MRSSPHACFCTLRLGESEHNITWRCLRRVDCSRDGTELDCRTATISYRATENVFDVFQGWQPDKIPIVNPIIQHLSIPT